MYLIYQNLPRVHFCKIVFCLFVFFQNIGFAQVQSIVVKGTVKDNEGQALSGVSVGIKNSPTVARTNVDGGYTITVPSSQSVLVFSHLGFVTVERPVGANNIVHVTLQEDYRRMDEVVVVGYGTQLRSEVTGSVSSIKADQMDEFSGGSLNTSLQGKIAGLQITTESGEPGSGATFNLRGVSSINGDNSPLIIIDGIPINNETFHSEEDGAGFSPLNDINPTDIESIEVLKDAATAAIYGSRASNGVVLITTKSGSTPVPTINFSLNSSLVGISRKIGVLNGPQFRDAYIESIFNSGTLVEQESLIDSLHPFYRDSYNWQDIMYRNAFQHKADLNVSGASKDKAINYYISTSYKDLKPIIVETDYKQVTGAARVNYKITKSIEGYTNFNLSNFAYDRLNTGGGESSIILRYLRTIPVYSPYDPITGDLIHLYEQSKISPLSQAINMENKIKRSRLMAKQQLVFHIIRGLDFKTSVGLDYSNTETNYFTPSLYAVDGKRVYTSYRPTTFYSLINENVLTYKKRIAAHHNLDVLLGQSFQNFKTDGYFFRGTDFVDDIVSSLAGAANITNFSHGVSERRLLSYFSRVNYNYKSKYLLAVLLRRDASSRFAEQNRAAYFPSVSLGWNFTKEKFLKNAILTDGKLRASYGVTGNQGIDNYASLGVLRKAGVYLGQTAIVQSYPENPTLRWETTKQIDVGADLDFLKGRFGLSLDFYQKNTSDLLFNVQIPNHTGFRTVPYNYGNLQNRGIDLSLNGTIINKPFIWNSIFTFGLNRNKVTDLPGGEDYRPNETSLARIGVPVGVFYGLRALGVYSRDEDNVYRIHEDGTVQPYRKGSLTGEIYKGGDVIYEDINGDGIINDDDLQIIGNPTPKYFGGFQNNFSYKGFKLSIFFNYVIGNDIFNLVRRSHDGFEFRSNYSTDQLRRWQKPGDVTDIPRLISADPMQNYAISSRFVEDGSFIRLQTLSLNYTIPTGITKRYGMKGASIGISGQNLLTWSAYTGYDPEVTTGGDLSFGVDNGSFPKSRFYNVSLNIRL